MGKDIVYLFLSKLLLAWKEALRNIYIKLVIN